MVLEAAPALPPPVARAEARGVVTLRQPPRDEVVLALVQSFVDGWQQASLDTLVALLAPEAGPIEGRGRGRSALVDSWRQRLQAHPYARLAGAQLVRADRIGRWDWEELDAPGTPPRPQEMRPGEIYLRVPLEVTRVAGEKLFGDVMVMLLRADGGKLAIAAYGEDDSL